MRVDRIVRVIFLIGGLYSFLGGGREMMGRRILLLVSIPAFVKEHDQRLVERESRLTRVLIALRKVVMTPESSRGNEGSGCDLVALTTSASTD